MFLLKNAMRVETIQDYRRSVAGIKCREENIERRTLIRPTSK